jgi:hypothetical protein
MKDKHLSGHKPPEAPSADHAENKSCSPEEAKVWAALEQARQNVKPIVKKEREAEVVTAELLNLRLKAIG